MSSQPLGSVAAGRNNALDSRPRQRPASGLVRSLSNYALGGSRGFGGGSGGGSGDGEGQQEPPTLTAQLLSTVVGGFVGSLAMTPFVSVIQSSAVRSGTRHPHPFTGFRPAWRAVSEREGGWTANFSGSKPGALALILRDGCTTVWGHGYDPDTSTAVQLLRSALFAVVREGLALPFEVVCHRMATIGGDQYGSMAQAFQTIVDKEGVMALYPSFAANVGRGILADMLLTKGVNIAPLVKVLLDTIQGRKLNGDTRGEIVIMSDIWDTCGWTGLFAGWRARSWAIAWMVGSLFSLGIPVGLAASLLTKK